MIYDFDIRSIVRRFVPVWFRRPVNLQFAYALVSYCEVLQVRFLAWRGGTILPQFHYNGMLHSMEWMLNDFFDSVERRIYITVADQVPVMYHLDQSDAPVVRHQEEGSLSGYYHLDESTVVEPYRYEFLVNVPVALSGVRPRSLFATLDLWRWAGRRPAIRYFDESDNTVSVAYYGAELPFNHP